MEILPIEIYGFAVDVPFPKPVGYRQAELEEFGAKICDSEKGLNLRVDQIRLKRSDDLYGYELTGNFFGENGSVSRNAERAKLSIRNARNAADWNLIRELFMRFYNIMEFDSQSFSTVSSHVHARFESAEDRNAYMEGFGHGVEHVRPAALGYVRIADWEKDIRILIEQSNAVTDGVFVAWDTQFANNQDWESFLQTLPTMMENSANLFGLGFEPFKQPA